MNSFLKKLRILWLALFDRQVPLMPKILLLVGAIYGLSPLDLIPDLLPILGQLDDLGVLAVVFWIFYRAVSKQYAKQG